MAVLSTGGTGIRRDILVQIYQPLVRKPPETQEHFPFLPSNHKLFSFQRITKLCSMGHFLSFYRFILPRAPLWLLY